MQTGVQPAVVTERPGAQPLLSFPKIRGTLLEGARSEDSRF